MSLWHNAIAGNSHPDGKPWRYCLICGSVIVWFVGQWWHLNRKAQGAIRKNMEADR